MRRCLAPRFCLWARCVAASRVAGVVCRLSAYTHRLFSRESGLLRAWRCGRAETTEKGTGAAPRPGGTIITR
eukprot:12226622-Alexandrium_andersonii.AAC.1